MAMGASRAFNDFGAVGAPVGVAARAREHALEAALILLGLVGSGVVFLAFKLSLKLA